MPTSESPAKYVVLRSNMSGVWAGILRSDPKEGVWVLHKARRACTWSGALSCSELAVFGPGPESAIAVCVSEVMIITSPGDECLSMEDAAIKAWDTARIATIEEQVLHVSQ